MSEVEDTGWKVFFIDMDKTKTVPDYFREDVMWYLVEKGYFAYIQAVEVGNGGRVFQSIIIDQGWGLKIINKRIELCGKLPENTFMRVRMEEYKNIPLSKIISYNPGFFDYLF